MHRIIKFRIWTGEEMVILPMAGTGYFDFEGSYALSFAVDGYDGFWAHENYSGPSKEAKKFPIMQFTGLLDKNKKEIYEGDILCPFLESIGPYWIVFENGSFICYHKHGRWGLLSRVFEADILRDYSVEVIGNIYQNPELLK